MPDIIYFKQGHITCKHLFIFCGFYRHNIQPRVKKTAFLYSFMAWELIFAPLFINLSDIGWPARKLYALERQNIGLVT